MQAEKSEKSDAAEKNKKPAEKRLGKSDNSILIGKKEKMSYVLAVITQFSGGADTVNVKARGRSISTAVDVAEIVRNRFLPNVKAQVEIGTDEVEGERGRLKVSAINIKLSR